MLAIFPQRILPQNSLKYSVKSFYACYYWLCGPGNLVIMRRVRFTLTLIPALLLVPWHVMQAQAQCRNSLQRWYQIYLRYHVPWWILYPSCMRDLNLYNLLPVADAAFADRGVNDELSDDAVTRAFSVVWHSRKHCIMGQKASKMVMNIIYQSIW